MPTTVALLCRSVRHAVASHTQHVSDQLKYEVVANLWYFFVVASHTQHVSDQLKDEVVANLWYHHNMCSLACRFSIIMDLETLESFITANKFNFN